MTDLATEVAHWRYREKAIPRDIEEAQKSLEGTNRLRSDIMFRRTRLSDHLEDGVDRRPSSNLIARTDAEIERLSEVIALNQYLLEEARYMTELLAIRLRVSEREERQHRPSAANCRLSTHGEPISTGVICYACIEEG